MAKRLQVILQDPECREIQRMARSRRMSLAEWVVRQALDVARRREPVGSSAKKLMPVKRVRNACSKNWFPIASDWSAMPTQEILHRYVAMNRRDAIQPLSTLCSRWRIKCCR